MSCTIPHEDSSPQLVRARELHTRLVAAREELGRARHRVAVVLRELIDDGLHRELGCATVEEYAERLLKLDVRTAQDLLTLGRRLLHLPQLDAKMAAGELEWTKIRELARVATEETEGSWLGFAEGRSAREVERAVRGRDVGELPPADGQAPKRPARQRLVYMAESIDAEAVRQMIGFVRTSMNARRGEVEDGAILAAIARRVLEDPTIVTGAQGAAATGTDVREGAVPTDTHVGEGERSSVKNAEPGAVSLTGAAGAGAGTGSGSGTHVGAGAKARAPTGEPYRIVLECCPSCGKVEGVDAEVSDTIVLESECDAEVHDHGDVTHEVPARVRREVLARDRWRCIVPGCRCGLWVHVHHLKSRALGGTNDARNLITLCSLHHRLVHEGRLAIWREGDVLVVEHADGTRETVRCPRAPNAG